MPRLSPDISQHAYKTAYAPFKPNKSGYRPDLPYYRGCWHGISRSLFIGYLQYATRGTLYPPIKAVYNP